MQDELSELSAALTFPAVRGTLITCRWYGKCTSGLMCLFGEITHFYRWICIEEQKAFIPSDRAWLKFISVKIVNIFSSFIIKSSPTSKEHSSTASWLPVPLIKHVYYSMSFHQSTHSAPQILCVFLSYEWVVSLRVCFTPLTYSVVLYGKLLRLLSYFCPLSLIFRCKSHLTALHTFVFLTSHCLQILSVYSLASAPKWNIGPTSCRKVL